MLTYDTGTFDTFNEVTLQEQVQNQRNDDRQNTGSGQDTTGGQSQTGGTTVADIGLQSTLDGFHHGDQRFQLRGVQHSGIIVVIPITEVNGTILCGDAVHLGINVAVDSLVLINRADVGLSEDAEKFIRVLHEVTSKISSTAD